MNLTHDAMLVSLRISAWSGRLYDRKASNHVAVHHEASVSAGRYNKCLLPKAAFAALTATMSKARSSHYEQTLPWDDQGSRLLTVANYEHYMQLLDGHRERMVPERTRFIEDYEDNIDQARLDLGKLFRIEDYPLQESLQGKFGIRYRITPVPDADHFMAKLASDDTDRVKGEVSAVAAPDVEPVGVLEHPRVAVGRAEEQRDVVALLERNPVHLAVLAHAPEIGLHR